MASTFRNEMIRSLSSEMGYKRGEVRYEESDAFYTRLVGLLRVSRSKERLRRSLAEVPELDDAMRGRLYRAFGHATVGEILGADEAAVARALGVDRIEVRQAKRTLLRAVAGPRIPDLDRPECSGGREKL